ncbi:hypothetical protein B0H11DRAFT_2225213 [Mycena galericulata]|nr:hypothetical protein B0H11DRAFT_2225213 [Mycena galericulata]
MASTTTFRSRPSSSSTPPALRRRMHANGQASSGPAFTATTADSSTRFGDGSDGEGGEDGDELSPLPSPPTSFAYEEEDGEEMEGEEGYDEDDEGERAQERAGMDNGNGHIAPDAAEDDAIDPPHTPRPWYQPSLPVLLALAPPIGNWLTGGDHVKDLLLLLLLVFYLHQLVEVPWNLYHAARPRRPPSGSSSTAAPAPILRSASSPDTSASTAAADTSTFTTRENDAAVEEHVRVRALAHSELRAIELLLLLLALSAPLLGVLLLRSLASLTSSPTPANSTHAQGNSSATPISWFSTTLFALLTALRPLRELVSRVSARTSTLHTLIHSPPPPSSHSYSTHVEKGEFEELKSHLARLDAELRKLRKENREAMQAVEVYVEGALTPLEDGVRRVERRVGKLRAASKSGRKGEIGNGKVDGTIFVPVPSSAAPSRQGVLGLLSWFAAPTSAYASVPLSSVSQVGNASAATNGVASGSIEGRGGGGVAAGKRRALEAIPEDGVLPSPSPSAYASAPAYFAPHAPSAYPSASAYTSTNAPMRRTASAPTVAVPATAILRWCIMLALWPLWVVLWPLRVLAIPVRGMARVIRV